MNERSKTLLYRFYVMGTVRGGNPLEIPFRPLIAAHLTSRRKDGDSDESASAAAEFAQVSPRVLLNFHCQR